MGTVRKGKIMQQNSHPGILAQPSARRSRNMLRVVALGAVGLASASVLTGCSGMAETFSDRWNVEYQVTAAEGDLGSVTKIEYQNWANTLDRDATVKIPEKDGEAAGLSGGEWKQDTIVGAGLDAKLRVEGAAVPLSCKIILDGKDVVAEATAEPGDTLECAATLPKFDAR